MGRVEVLNHNQETTNQNTVLRKRGRPPKVLKVTITESCPAQNSSLAVAAKPEELFDDFGESERAEIAISNDQQGAQRLTFRADGRHIRDYLRQAGKISFLSREDEVRLGETMKAAKTKLSEQTNPVDQTKYITARNELVQTNLRLVASVAGRYIGRGLDYEDLIQEGNMGLLHAAEKFDHEKGFRFSTYATWWIRESISRAVEEKTRMISIPSDRIDEANNLTRITAQMEQFLCRTPTTEELAETLETTPERIQSLQRDDFINGIASFSAPTGEDKNDGVLADTIRDNTSPDPQREVEKALVREKIGLAIKSLGTRDRMLVVWHFELDGDKRSKEEVAKQLGIKVESLRPTISDAVKKLREHLKDSGYPEEFI